MLTILLTTLLTTLFTTLFTTGRLYCRGTSQLSCRCATKDTLVNPVLPVPPGVPPTNNTQAPLTSALTKPRRAVSVG